MLFKRKQKTRNDPFWTGWLVKKERKILFRISRRLNESSRRLTAVRLRVYILGFFTVMVTVNAAIICRAVHFPPVAMPAGLIPSGRISPAVIDTLSKLNHQK